MHWPGRALLVGAVAGPRTSVRGARRFDGPRQDKATNLPWSVDLLSTATAATSASKESGATPSLSCTFCVQTKTLRARILSKADADDELLPDTGCTFRLLNDKFAKYSVGQKKRRTEFNLATKGGPDASPFITDNVHLFHFPVRDEFGKVRQVPEEGVIHPSVGRGLLPCTEKEIFLSKGRRRRSYVRLTDTEGRSFRAPVK
uniref:Uncharacterized protein n=1 Tax=Chromera velia CCMP2878 TaxID=1169474 RepID=A0A0G4GKP1_9ALVE|eukprot:Cvel_22331.t1-p1 / transcript=Cvel_22331.t1 / gene=Cvel_22331 / organism=Chromera_velia_CCMP2878 / gene_product=hypothetical protein / transcript_product=hypothetical protein / location=Cvel_scaffold2185:2332-2934(+) / protein_length=201 / sequence_SO=supercontig / SO=protein_coding / is_pseudo=false